MPYAALDAAVHWSVYCGDCIVARLHARTTALFRERASGLLQVERCQELVRNRLPPVGIKPQKMAVTGNTVE